MEGKDRDILVDHESNSKYAELASYMEEYISTNKEAEGVKNSLDEVSREYHGIKKDKHALKKSLREAKDRLNKIMKEMNSLMKTLGEARDRLHKIEQTFRLILGTEPGAGGSGTGGSGQEAGDVKMGTHQSGESSDVRTGVEGKGEDLVAPGGLYSGKSEEQKKQCDTGVVSTDAEGLKQGMSGLKQGSGKTEGASQDKCP